MARIEKLKYEAKYIYLVLLKFKLDFFGLNENRYIAAL